MKYWIKRKTIFSLVAACGLAFAAPVMAQTAPETTNVDVAKLMQPGKLKDMSEGRADAPVTIVEYASLTCGHCASFYSATLPEIRKKYIDTGKVRLVFREIVFAQDKRSLAAVTLARCLPAGRYFPMVGTLFEKQQSWAFAANGASEALLGIASLAGLDKDGVKACLGNQQLVNDILANTKQATDEFGIRATPTFFINGTKYEGALTAGEMSAIIDRLL
ncbi:MAG: DSBA oxidoreductase [Candidatus Tokpelaia hoelldobleri]|uniref:DSBA oxidoreductase n=1 Tax=Candidatus Tokpelaia hoelldobleri TaxID=1902579 RepID=A0A1U9JW16_9HYPH|nr:MAG: DSBA oxidoreductase [Candidatus Tokpelaia hoelldoblerii]